MDDEPHLVGTYAAMLEDRHTVRTATSGEAALDQLTAEIDVVLLDRQMPGLSGDEVLELIREQESECRIAMVTAIDPDLDMVDLPFDAYLVKPIRHQDLHELVEDLLLRARFNDSVQESFAVASKLAALESQYDQTDLTTHEEYQTLREQKAQLDAQNQERITELMERGDTGLVFRDILRAIQDTDSNQ